jgi:hypothetical protein
MGIASRRAKADAKNAEEQEAAVESKAGTR